MVDINVAVIKELRKRTGSGIMECKTALTEAQGNIELAINNMRKLGQAKAVKKAGYATKEGVILVQIAQDGKRGVIIELNCETDFTAKNSSFKAFGNTVINVAINECITDCARLKARFEDQRIALVAKIGENIDIRRISTIEGSVLCSYQHGTRIGVIVSAINANEKLMKYIAMHIAASKPEYINADDVPSDVVICEQQIQLEIAMQTGKSREIAEKIVKGRMRKFIDTISLIGQDFVMDPSQTVGQLLEKHNAKINNFIRLEVSDGTR